MSIYKEAKHTKLGVTFFRQDQQPGAPSTSALVSRVGETGPAAHQLEIGERIMSVQGTAVEGPLHAAKLLRESEGYLRVGKLPKRPDFDENLSEYLRLDAELVAAQLAPKPQPPKLNVEAAAAMPTGGGESEGFLNSARRHLDSISSINLGEQAGELTARGIRALGAVGTGVVDAVDAVAAVLPTQENRERRAAVTIQTARRGAQARQRYGAERAALLLLQSSIRRKLAADQAGKVRRYKRTLENWAALVIQEARRNQIVRRKLRERARLRASAEAAERAAAASASKGPLASAKRLARSLSFTRRNAASASKKGAEAEAEAAGEGRAEEPPSVPTAESPAPEMLAGDREAEAKAEGGVTKLVRKLSFSRRRGGEKTPSKATAASDFTPVRV